MRAAIEQRTQTPDLYGYPALTRAGLGNLLFPWGRCYLWCRDQGCRMLAPFWTGLRIGPILRGEKDLRRYGRLFHHDGYISGARRLLFLWRYRRIPESGLRPGSQLASRSIVLFEGMKGLFQPLANRHTELWFELNRITRPAYRADKVPAKFIAIHVRRGDFSLPLHEGELKAGRTNCQIPIAWYAYALAALRRVLGNDIRCLLFSDGRERELMDLLSQSNVYLFEGGNALTDLLAMAQASALIASGSTFSMWASFLGQMPTVWYPGQRRARLLQPAADGIEREPCLEQGDRLPAGFDRAVHDHVPPPGRNPKPESRRFSQKHD